MKLRAGIAVLFLTMAVSSISSYFFLSRIDADLFQIVNIEEPLEQAVLEMEINANETSKRVE